MGESQPDLGCRYKIRFFKFEKTLNCYNEVFFKTSKEIAGISDQEISEKVNGQVMAYARSVDEHLNTRLYDKIFNSLEPRAKKGTSPVKGRNKKGTSPVKGRNKKGTSPVKGSNKRASVDLANDKRPTKKRYTLGQQSFFGRYQVKERERHRVDCVLPWHAIRVYNKGLEVTMPDDPKVEMAEMDKGRRNINLTLATKLPKKSEDWLFDPMVKDRDLKQLLCLKPGMRVS